MSASRENPAVDAILLKVMEAVPFQLTTDGGVEEARRHFREIPRSEVHSDVRGFTKPAASRLSGVLALLGVGLHHGWNDQRPEAL
jgi:hypothetical protein